MPRFNNFSCVITITTHCCGLVGISSPGTTNHDPNQTHGSFLYIPEGRAEKLKEFTKEFRDYMKRTPIGGKLRGMAQLVMRTSTNPQRPDNYGLDDSLIEAFKEAGWIVGPSWHTSEYYNYRITQFSLIIQEWKDGN